MKYTILGFQQTKLIENKLDIVDALILRTIKDMYSSASMEFINEKNERYMWINYTYFLSQIPIVGSKSNLNKRIKKYGDLNLISRVHKVSRKGQKGSYAYIAPTKILDSLQDYDPYVNNTQGLCKKNTEPMENIHYKDTSIRDTSIKDTKDGSGSIFKEIVKTYQDNGFGLINAGTRDNLVDLTETYTDSWVLEAIDIAVKSNARNLRYVEGILKKWQAEGKGNQKQKADDPYAGMEMY